MTTPAVVYGSFGTPYETGSVQQFPIGQKMVTPDGGAFRYTEMGGTVGVANKLYQGAAMVPNFDSLVIVVAMAVGDTTVSLTNGATAIVVNYFAGGTLVVEETDDLGHIYPIKSNTAIGGGGGAVTFTLQDGATVQNAVAVAGSNVATPNPNPWKDAILSIAGVTTAMIIGVPRVIIALDEFGWSCTRGVASCLIDSGAPAILVGNAIRVSESVAGAVALSEETAGIMDKGAIGFCLETAPDADFGGIYLTID